MPPAPVVSRRLLTVAAMSVGALIYVMISAGIDASKRHALVHDIPYNLPPATNLHQGAAHVCRQIAGYNGTKSRWQWQRDVERENARLGARRATGDDFMRKVHTWPGPPKSTAETGDRVLCAGWAHDEKNMAKIAQLYGKWSAKCDQTLIFTRKPASVRLEGVPEELVVRLGADVKSGHWQFFGAVVRHIMAKPGLLRSVDFVLFHGDDSHINVQNLRKMLREPYYVEMSRLAVPLLVGHRLTTPSNVPMVSNSAWVMNTVALRILASLLTAHICSPDDLSGADDVNIGSCFGAIGIQPLDTTDEFGEDRFHVFSPWMHADVVGDPKVNPWYPQYRQRAMQPGMQSVSMYTVGWHFLEMSHVDTINKALAKQDKGFSLF
jgi:hypothetical protein